MKNNQKAFLLDVTQIKGKDVAGYIFLPRIIPRVKELTGSGFSWLAYLMATIYATVRLLPLNHPYLNPENSGKFTIRNVIVEAANNLEFKKSNIDQIVVFFALLMGFVVLVVQFVMILFMVLVQPALAGMFDTPQPEKDVAFMLLDYVFGVPDFFCNQAGMCSEVQPTLPTPIHSALHALFHFYSLAILIVAVFIFIYYLFVVVGETAQTGSPFGRRFSKVWAPIRLVVALGLLLPLEFGLNTAQYITLFAARHGSGWATNAWIMFNRDISAPYTLNDESALITAPKTPDLAPFVGFMLLVSSCEQAFELLATNSSGSTFDYPIDAYLVKMPSFGGQTRQQVSGGGVFPYDDNFAGGSALSFYDGRDVMIRYGHHDSSYSKWKGQVSPLCGELRIHTVDAHHYRNGGLAGPLYIQSIYYRMAIELLENPDVKAFGRRAACIHLNSTQTKPGYCNAAFAEGETNENKLPSAEFFVDLVKKQMDSFTNEIQVARTSMMKAMQDSGDINVTDEQLAHGWGGAGMWYNMVAQWNGSLVSSIVNIPTPQKMPLVMDFVRKQKLAHDENVSTKTIYDPGNTNRTPIDFSSLYPQGQDQIARVLHEVHTYLAESQAALASEQMAQGNIFIDILNKVLGLEGLFEMRTNATTHPLAQLTALGKSMMDASIRNLFVSMGLAGGGGFLEAMAAQNAGSAAAAIGKIASSMASMGLTVGFILYYVLPFMPFIYFFFAVGNWVKTIFEAMVGVPLWALAHLRIDGEGLPSQAASNGYYLILEIFIRPILIIFGLLASVSIFSALARTLNEIFPLLTNNLAGYQAGDAAGTVDFIEKIKFKRGVVDEFFFTIIYTILIYLMAQASFKLIDQIPNSILRWIGAGVQSFGDQSGDPTQGLVQYASIGMNQMGSQVVGAAEGLARGAGQAAGTATGLIFGRSGAEIKAGGSGGASSATSITGTPPKR